MHAHAHPTAQEYVGKHPITRVRGTSTLDAAANVSPLHGDQGRRGRRGLDQNAGESIVVSIPQSKAAFIDAAAARQALPGAAAPNSPADTAPRLSAPTTRSSFSPGGSKCTLFSVPHWSSGPPPAQCS